MRAAGTPATHSAAPSAPRPFDPAAYGDPAWRDLKTNPHGDPACCRTEMIVSATHSRRHIRYGKSLSKSPELSMPGGVTVNRAEVRIGNH